MKTKLSFALALFCGSILSAQNVISAHSGLIHFVEGYGTTLDGALVAPKAGEFPLMRDGQTLATEESRVEVLLTPGAFLRLAEQSSLKMVTTRLSDTRAELLTGSAVLELDEVQKGNNLMLLFHGAKITPLKHGLYRLDANENRFRVFEGEAQVLQGQQTAEVKTGHQIEFGAVLANGKFNRKTTDALDAWAAVRSERIAQANLVSANMMSRGGASSSYTNSSWVWNPIYELLTYLPARGYGYNPYGWMIYSPQTVVNFYNGYQQQQPSTYSANNSSIDSRGSISNASMSNGAASSNPNVVAAPAASAPAAMTSMSRGSVSSSGGGQGR
jgi:hypothetical protein